MQPVSRLLGCLRRRARDEQGVALIFVVIGLPAFLFFGVFVIDVGNWWVHKRHLQVQADAAALAGAMAYRLPACNDNEVVAEAMKYSGAGSLWDTAPPSYAAASSSFNNQLGGTDPDKVFAGINRPSVYGREDVVIDADLVGSPTPCDTGFVDAKVTETDLPWFFQLTEAGTYFTDKFGLTDSETAFIDAQARVTLRSLVGRKGTLPLGVEDVNPKSGHVWIYEETSTPATAPLLGQADLELEPDAFGRLSIWSNAATGSDTPITFSPHTSKMAVRIGLSGASTTDWSATDVCTRSLVLCYGYGVPTATPALDGVTRIRGVDTSGTGAPRVGDVDLFSLTCADTSLPTGAENGYFNSSCASVRAEVVLVGANTTSGNLRGRVTGMQGNQTNPLVFNSVTNRWVGTFPLDPATAAHKLALEYRQSGQGSPCPNNNPCLYPDVHSSFRASRARSGPLKMVRIDTVATDGTGFATNDNNVPRCGASTSCPLNFIVRAGLGGNLALAQPGDDPIALRVFGGSQNQSLDCDPYVNQDLGKKPDLADEIALGCSPGYVKNTGQQCPSQQDLWNPLVTPQPWNCVAIQTGTQANKPAEGMNRRVYGDPSPGNNAPCPTVGSNRYDQFPAPDGDGVADYPGDDKRIVPLFLVPFGTFDGSGNEVVPVIGFASFYVTGWTSNGNGFRNPCKDDGDEFEFGTEDDSGAISGHFIIRVESSETGTPGETNCDTTIIGGCVAVMTK